MCCPLFHFLCSILFSDPVVALHYRVARKFFFQRLVLPMRLVFLHLPGLCPNLSKIVGNRFQPRRKYLVGYTQCAVLFIRNSVKGAKKEPVMLPSLIPLCKITSPHSCHVMRPIQWWVGGRRVKGGARARWLCFPFFVHQHLFIGRIFPRHFHCMSHPPKVLEYHFRLQHVRKIA